MKTLYKLNTCGLASFYVIAEHSSEAETKLNTLLNSKDYSLFSYRKVISIEVIASEIKNLPTKFDILIL